MRGVTSLIGHKGKKQMVLIAFCCLLGAIALFATGWKASDIHRNHVRGTFKQRQHCMVLGKRYQNEHQTSMISYALLDSGYSGALDTCVVELQMIPSDPRLPNFIEVNDVLNGRLIYGELCKQPCTGDELSEGLNRGREDFGKVVIR
jgi:hypothetical protein